jgi:type IV pilus assembly protein PilA
MPMSNQKGFTLIELMMVVSIIGILAAIAIPQFSAYRIRAYRCEGYVLADPVRKDIQEYVDVTGRLPGNNAMAGLPEKKSIRGKYVDSIEINHGIISVIFSDSIPSLKGQYLKLIPEVNPSNPTGPLTWEIEKKDEKDTEKGKTANH